MTPATLIPTFDATLFPTSIFLHSKRDNALNDGEGSNNYTSQNARLFLLSNDCKSESKPLNPKPKNKPKKKPKRSLNRKSKKPKRSLNRKSVSYSGLINHSGIEYKINGSRKKGVYLAILHKAIEQLEICQEKWGRVLVVRFDLHQEFYRPNNKKVSNFVDALKRRIQRKYGFDDIGYLNVREQERAKAQHYHFVLFLDGSKVRHSSHLLRMVKSTWEGEGKRKIQGHYVPVIKNPYYFVDNESVKADAIYRISYLCKERGKGYQGKYANDYNTSRLTKKVKL